jgi:hypothetical protein
MDHPQSPLRIDEIEERTHPRQCSFASPNRRYHEDSHRNYHGAISGFLIYMMFSLVFFDVSAGGPSPAIVFILFFGGTALSAWFLRREARNVSRVVARGFLLGAAEWMVMILVGVIFAGKSVSSATDAAGGSSAAAAGSVLGGGMLAFLTGGVSLFMIVVCLAGFTIAHFIGREMKDTTATPTRKCPECAEMVQQDARKCRYCGTALAGAPAQA